MWCLKETYWGKLKWHQGEFEWPNVPVDLQVADWAGSVSLGALTSGCLERRQNLVAKVWHAQNCKHVFWISPWGLLLFWSQFTEELQFLVLLYWLLSSVWRFLLGLHPFLTNILQPWCHLLSFVECLNKLIQSHQCCKQGKDTFLIEILCLVASIPPSIYPSILSCATCSRLFTFQRLFAVVSLPLPFSLSHADDNLSIRGKSIYKLNKMTWYPSSPLVHQPVQTRSWRLASRQPGSSETAP